MALRTAAPRSALSVAILLCLVSLLLDSSSCVAALGPVQANIQRSDGLCSLLVAPLQSYACTEYSVQTDDGFLIGVQRVSRKRQAGALKGPVLLLHGIVLGGDVWFLSPPDQAFGPVLADAGYDVWVANTRTTRFSYGHVSFNRKDKRFWEWSVDELAQYDLPAMLGLVNAQTNKKAHFIGFSQGSQQAFIAFSQGRLLDLVEKNVFLGPVAYINHVSAPVAKLSATFYIDKLYEALHIYEFSTQYRKKEVVDIICRPAAVRCFETYVALFTGNNCCLNYSRRTIIDTYETQSTSTKNLAHLAQQYRQKTFAKFDYGWWGNLMRYGRLRPPAYNVGTLPTADAMFMYGGNDALSDPEDVAFLFSILGHANPYPSVLIPAYAHLDFLFATNAKQLVYDPVIRFLLK